jgi:hypothetical protein
VFRDNLMHLVFLVRADERLYIEFVLWVFMNVGSRKTSNLFKHRCKCLNCI